MENMEKNLVLVMEFTINGLVNEGYLSREVAKKWLGCHTVIFRPVRWVNRVFDAHVGGEADEETIAIVRIAPYKAASDAGARIRDEGGSVKMEKPVGKIYECP